VWTVDIAKKPLTAEFPYLIDSMSEGGDGGRHRARAFIIIIIIIIFCSPSLLLLTELQTNKQNQK